MFTADMLKALRIETVVEGETLITRLFADWEEETDLLSESVLPIEAIRSSNDVTASWVNKRIDDEVGTLAKDNHLV